MKLSVIIVAFKSDHLLEDLILSLPTHHDVIVVENSLQVETKKNLENKFSNVQVIVPEKNLGYSGGINLGIKKSKNKFVLALVADLILSKEMISNLEKCLMKFTDFTLIAPIYKNESVHKNYKIFHNNNVHKFNIDNFNIKEVDEIDGAFLLINKDQFDTDKVLDENYFLYFESTDLCNQLRKNKKKMYVIENLFFTHKGLASSNKEYEFEILINRNWHYSWSKFYYYKKNNNYIIALKKIFPNFVRSLIQYIKSILLSDSKKAKLNKAILSGLINSILLKKSSYRPNI